MGIIVDVLFLVILAIAVGAGFYYGVFSAIAGWLQFILLFLVPAWLAPAIVFSNVGGEKVLSGIGESLGGLVRGVRLPSVAQNFIEAKFVPNAEFACENASQWLTSFAALAIMQVILFVVMLILVIVGKNIGGHYLAKKRAWFKSFRRVDNIAGGIMGVVNAYIIFCMLLGAINVLLPDVLLADVAEIIRGSVMGGMIYDSNFIGDGIGLPYVTSMVIATII